MKYPYWAALEAISSLEALEPTWKKLLASQFPAFRDAFLDPGTDPVRDCLCPRHCGCFHRLAWKQHGSIIAQCQCPDPQCPDIHLTPADIRLWEFNWQKLARALCNALNLAPKHDSLNMRRTIQIGSWSTDAIPVLLTIYHDPFILRSDAPNSTPGSNAPSSSSAQPTTHLASFKTEAEPLVYQRLPDGSAILDGYPIIWTDVLQPYGITPAPDKPIAVFGALNYWWFGEHGSPRIDQSPHVWFANDQLAVRFIEEIDFDYCAADATSALITAAA